MPTMNLPAGDGVLTPASRGAYKLILFVAGWFLAGVAAAIAVFTVIGAPAHAKEPNLSVETQLGTLLTDISEIKKDLAYVKCRLNVSNVCPPER